MIQRTIIKIQILVLLVLLIEDQQQIQTFQGFLECVHVNCNIMKDDCMADKLCEENSQILSENMKNPDLKACQEVSEVLKVYYPKNEFPVQIYQNCLNEAQTGIKEHSELSKQLFQCRCQCSEGIEIGAKTQCKYTEEPLELKEKEVVVDDEVQKEYEEAKERMHKEEETQQQYEGVEIQKEKHDDL